MKGLWFVLSASLLSAAVGCRSTYGVAEGVAQEGLVAFACPADYSVLGTESAREWLEVLDARQGRLPNGNLWLELSVRNRGNQGFLSWGDRSRDMTLYAEVTFLDGADGDRVVQAVPKRAVPLPLGRAVHLRWEATAPRATTARILFSE